MRFLFIFLILTWPFAAFAEPKSEEARPLPDHVVLDGKEYPKQQILIAFLDAAFTKDILNEKDGVIIRGSSRGFYAEEYLEKAYPWLAPHVAPSNGLPKLLVVNKWVEPIRISLGMPNSLKPFVEHPEREPYILVLPGAHLGSEQKNTAAREIVEREIRTLGDELRGLVDPRVEYIAPEMETLNSFGNLRINLVPEQHFSGGAYKKNPEIDHSYFGSGYGKQTIPLRGARSGVEKHIKTGFPFTSRSKSQVDGYFLSNPDNEIQLAVCYIWDGHEADMLRALVRECIIRSLGLPGAIRVGGSYSVPRSALTLWNEPDKWPEKHRAEAKPPAGLSEFDEYLIRLLYGMNMKPGTDYVEAQRILLGVHTE